MILYRSTHTHERACRNSSLANRLRNRLPLVLPRLQGTQKLHDLVRSRLSDIVNADGPHLDIVIEQEVEQTEEAVQFVVMGSRGKSRIRYWRRRRPTFDVFREPEQRKATEYSPRGIGHLERFW